MSAKSTVVAAWLGAVDAYVKNLRVLRYAVGSTLAMTVALGFDWQLSFLTPVLTLSFLATPAPRPTLKEGAMFVVTIGIACMAGLLLSRFMLHYAFVYVPFAGLVLLRLFHAKSGGTSPLLITWMLIALLVIPLVAMQSPGIANFIARNIVFGALVSMLVVWLSYALLPDPVGIDGLQAAQATGEIPPPPTKGERFATALESTVVVFPLLTLFYMLEWLDSVLILIFVAILSLQPGFAKNFQAGKALIVGNVIGGVAAIVFYELLVAVPEFAFMVLLTLFSALMFGALVFSGKPKAPLYGMAFSTVLLVIGSTTSSSGEAGAKVYTRVFQIMLAVGYVVAAFGTIEWFKRHRREA